MKNRDVIVSLMVIGIIFLMILPVPTFLLDSFQMINISFSLVIILATMYVRSALELSSFPSILLVVTLLRLSLNITSTRLILLNGNNFDGKVIKTFGNFVVSGNYVVGLIIFLILVIIQFIVITKGAERISEVGARFTLDAMPGKQMSVDADYNAGLITEDEARKKREDIRREADFYGAMDGASKFVRGDAIAGIIIVFINIIGGLIIGVVQLGMEVGEAAQVFTLLTVGDGLASQIPALLISTSSGILVSRSASESNLGNDMLRELASETKVLYLTGGVLVFLTLFTPLPTFLGLLIGGGLILIAYFSSQKEKEAAVAAAGGGGGGGFAGLEGPKPKGSSAGGEAEKAEAPSAPSLTSAEEVSEIIQSDTLDVEFGYGILPLADPGQGGDLLDRITMVRKQTAYEYGLILSPIRVRDSVLLKANEYMIKLKGTELTKYELWPDRLLAINPGTAQGVLPGIASKEPAFGLEAYWIDETQRDQATSQGYTVVDPPSVFATHFSEIVKQHAYELLGRREMDLLIKGLKENFSELVDEVIPDLLKIHEVQRILQNLLRERVSIRNLPLIFETISEYAEKTKDIDYLTEFVRRALKRQICIANRSDDGQIHAVGIDPNLERQLSSQIRETEDERYLALNPDLMQQLVDSFSKGVEKIMQKGYMPVIVSSGNIRIYLYKALEKSLQSIAFISYEELVDDIPFSVETVIKI